MSCSSDFLKRNKNFAEEHPMNTVTNVAFNWSSDFRANIEMHKLTDDMTKKAK